MMAGLEPISSPVPLQSLILTVITLLVAVTCYLLYNNGSRSPTVKPHLATDLARCQPAKWLPSRLFCFGMDLLLSDFRNLKARKFLSSHCERYRRFGRTHKVPFFRRQILSSDEPENIKAVLTSEFQSWNLPAQRKTMVTAMAGEGIFAVDGEHWKWSRELLRPVFNSSRVRSVERFEVHTDKMIAKVRQIGEGETVDIQPLFAELVMDITSEFLFGDNSGCLDEGAVTGLALAGQGDRHIDPEQAKKVRDFVRSFNHILHMIEGKDDDRWGTVRLFASMFLPISTELKRCIRTMNEYVDDVVSRGFAKHDLYHSEKSNYLLLQELINQTSDRTRIRSELLNVLLAARESTVAALTNIWFEISRRPALWHQLQTETASLNGTVPTFDHLKDMKYLNAVIKESLRLYPVLGENNREAIEDTILPVGGGQDGKSPILVKKGTLFHFSTWSMHRRDDLYGEDAEEFKPERWLDGPDGKTGLRVSWEYLPFNGGPRICIGQQFALTEICFVTVRLLQDFHHIESRDPGPWREQIGAVVSKFGGCRVALKSQF